MHKCVQLGKEYYYEGFDDDAFASDNYDGDGAAATDDDDEHSDGDEVPAGRSPADGEHSDGEHSDGEHSDGDAPAASTDIFVELIKIWCCSC